MQIVPGGRLHLTYCTNIHAASGWAAVRANVGRFAPALKARLAPDRPFGIGLRLSAQDAVELIGGPLQDFRAFLADEGLYVAIINGFPHGSFHRSVVKADVYAPDWRDDARVEYTNRLIDILSVLAPPDLDAGVSTVPLSYKPWMREAGPETWERITGNVVRVAEKLVRVRQETGKLIHLDIEPEPDCAIETAGETVDFFERWLLPFGAPRLQAAIGGGVEEARQHLRDHVQVCFDCCHFAVEHEDPIQAIARLTTAGIRIGRVQLSSALRVAMPPNAEDARRVVDRLRPFADSTYLHQVIREHEGRLDHVPDLAEALDNPQPGEWRIHFHVPLFTSEYGGLASTHREVERVLSAAAAAPFTTHLEIETYTWDVLPAGLKLDLLESIAREYDWVLKQLPGHARTPAP